MHRPRVVLWFGLASVVLSAAAPAEPGREAERSPVRPAVRRISLFKNGLAYVELEVPAARAGWIEVIPPSLPLHGTFWVSHDPARVSVREAIAETVEVAEDMPVASLVELLRANSGRTVVLHVGEERIRGKLRAVPEPDPRDPTWPGQAAPQRKASALILVETEGGTIGLDPARVEQVRFGEPGPPSLSTVPEKRRENRLRVRVEDVTPGATFGLEFLTHGAAWAPSYRLALLEGGLARIDARADIIDDALDLRAVPALLVSGFPNLRFAHVAGPLALSGSLDAFLQQLGSEPGAGATRRREQVMAQSVYSNRAFASEEGFAPTTAAGLEGEAQEDMFVSRLGDLTLAKGGRANYALFTAQVPCEQVFRWEVADWLDDQGYHRPRDARRAPPEEVWHSLRLSNTTKSPWTTAPVTVVKDGTVLGQDVCFYTPTGGRSLVKVTKALNIRAEQQELEVERSRQAERLYGSDYDRVTIKGALRLGSYKAHDVSVEISKTLSGDLVSAEAEPTVVKLGRGLSQVNPLNQVNWKLSLAAGKERRIEYVYKVLVRR